MSHLVRFDWAIKYLLRNKANFDILEGFLSELLKRDIRIESVLESESNKVSADDKFNRVDLLVEADHKERIIIEVQCSRQWDYFSRILYATSKTVTEHLKEGSPYDDIKRIISVSVVFFDLGSGEDYLYHGTTSFKGMHCHDTLQLGREEKKAYMNAESPAEIFPEYYLIKVDQFRESIQDKFDEWVYFLKNSSIKPDFDAQGIQSAAHKMDMLQLDESGRRAYERFQENLMYEASMTVVPYDIGRMDGLIQGELQGIEKGLQEGLQQGLEKGLQEGAKKEKESLVRSLLQKNFAFPLIAELTGLSLDVIAAFQKQVS